jgi:ATP/maltotriose-dependent transcriptional regulator MalT
MQLSGDLNKAKELIEHAIAITPKNNDTSQLVPRIKMTHANIIKGLGKYKDANKILLDALSTFGAPTLDNSIYIATAYYELAEYFVGNNKYAFGLATNN